MTKSRSFPSLALAALCGVLVTACGGGNDTPVASRVLEESALYHPVTHPSGAIEQPGDIAVLGLEANASDLPPPTGVPAKGVEDLWFEVKQAQPMQFALDADTLAAIARVEIRDAGNNVLATLSTSLPSTTLELGQGRYQAVVYTRATDATTLPVFARYASGPDVKSQGQADSAADRVRPQYDMFAAIGMFFGISCSRCSLRGISLPGWSFVGGNFGDSDLSGANLSGANLSKAHFDGANLAGANLTKANLSGASFTIAYLRNADLTGANLTDTSFTWADIGGAIWADGRRCKVPSKSYCQ